MATRSDISKLNIDRFHFSVRIRTLFFPVGLHEFTTGLQKKGFEILPQVQRLLEQTPIGTKLSVSGPVARRQSPDVQVTMDGGTGVLGVQGRDIQGVIAALEEIEGLLSEDLAVEISSYERFYELILEGEVYVGAARNPIDRVSSLYTDSKHFQALQKVLGEPVMTYGVRLVSKGVAPDTANWEEIKIEPSIAKAKTTYSVSIILRRDDKAAVQRFATRLPDLIERLIETIES